MKDATLARLKAITSGELEDLAARCNLPSLARKLVALSHYPRSFALAAQGEIRVPGWLGLFAGGLAPEEASRLDELLTPGPESPATEGTAGPAAGSGGEAR